VGVAYDTDINAALAAIDEVLQNNPRVLRDPAPILQAGRLGEWAVNIAVKPWVAVPDFGPATGEINQALLEALRRKQIAIPFPQQEVRLLRSAT